MTRFQSRPDGEYALCRSCERWGYGVDAWHPCTTEFWRTRGGLLIFSECKACTADRSARARGGIKEAA